VFQGRTLLRLLQVQQIVKSDFQVKNTPERSVFYLAGWYTVNMYILAFIFIFLLGTIIGSFLNVVIYRFGTGKMISRGRSICMICNRTLRWYELIPVFSFLIQSGRCRRCASKISHQYPSVEFGTGLLFTLLAFHFLPILTISQTAFVTQLVLYMLMFSFLIVIIVYDIRHKIIPDIFVYSYAIVALISVYIQPSLWGFLAGPILALPFALLWLVSGGRAMGLGDAKLILGIGWMLGISHGLSALVLAFWIGAAVSIAILLTHKKKMNMKSQIPFAPFLILGALLAFFFHLEILSLVSIFNVII
jgi:prepilin signal peptidase PulO-like enzyme (type II secretory pathway)